MIKDVHVNNAGCLSYGDGKFGHDTTDWLLSFPEGETPDTA